MPKEIYYPAYCTSISDPRMVDIVDRPVDFREFTFNLSGKTAEATSTVIDPAPLETMARCPYCCSSQLSASKRGFSVGSGLLGTFLTGNLAGMLLGTLGSDRVEVTCINCGRIWNV